MVEKDVDAYLADPFMAEALRQLVEVDHKIEGLNAELVSKLEQYQQRYSELKERIATLEQ